MSGILGRLGDLATVHEKFDIAVTTACGYLDHIVVDTITNGERCINYLKQNKIGSGKFICLDKIQ